MDVGILGRHSLHIVELPAHQDHDFGRIGGVADLLGVVYVVALNGFDLDAQVFGQAVGPLLGGVVEGAVPKGTSYHNRHGYITGRAARFLIVVLGFGAASQ